MSTRVRSFWLPSAAVAYVCFAALQAGGGSILPWVALVGLPLLLAEVWRRTTLPPPGEDRIEDSVRAALRAGVWGAAMWIAARTGPAGHPAFDAAGNLGAGTAVVAALVALARIAPLGGLLTAPAATRSLDAAAFAGLLWGVAAAVPATRALLPQHLARIDPLAIDYATTAAAAGSLLVLVAAAARLRAMRRLELGVSDRAAGALALSVTTLLVVLPAAALDVAAPDRLLPTGVIVASLLCVWAAVAREPMSVASALRGALAVVMLGAPTMLLGGVLAREMPAHGGAIVLAASALAILAGLVARAVARPLGPEQSRWLDAIEGASRGALQPEPDAAIRAALEALSKTTATAGARPELWRNHPEEVLRVDVAGYLHVEKAKAPPRLYELARDEPERTLRAEALRAVQVRRPDVRPLLAWFETRRAFSATVVVDEDGPSGFLLLPRGGRRSAMALEEARAVRLLADRISALLAVSSALARSRERELQATARADELRAEGERLEQILESGAGRNRLLAERYAEPARRSAYSAAARLAVEQLERLGRQGGPVALLAPPGVDATGWGALVHLASERSGGPLVIVDGAGSPERWESEDRSPLQLADGGTLLVLEAAALPAAVQEELCRRATGGPATASSAVPPPGLVITVGDPPDALADGGRMVRALAQKLGGSTVQLPALVDRAEDLRALVLDRLSRTGLRLRGEPLGVDPGALRLLVEHTWPGNELELDDVLTRAACAATGKVITAADLARAGFRLAPESSSTSTPMPVGPRPRPRPRRAPRGR